SFKKFTNHKNTFLFEIIRTNIQRGIAEGLYRKDINAELLSRFRLNMLLMPFNMEAFPPAQFNLNEISNAMTENFLYGLATEKGFEVIESYKQRKNQHDQ
ncbi:MAG: TetR/AcrR family transcriptional regulator, partial [Bacteroidota bacterium]